MRRTIETIALCVAIANVGCDDSHASKDDLGVFIDAVQFGDLDRVYEMHAESTEFSAWCDDSFKSVLSRAKDTSDASECERIGRMSRSDLDALPDELRLAVQVSRFVCEKPQGTCIDYSRTVFYEAAKSNPLLTEKPKSVVVKRHFGDDVNAAAYVEFHYDDDRLVQRVLELRKFGSRWRVHRGLLE